MALEAVHELVCHDAVGAEEVRAVDAARDGVRLLGLAAGAAGRGRARLAGAGQEVGVLLYGGGDDEVGQQAEHAGGWQLAVHATGHAGDFVGVGLLSLETAAAECVETVEYFWVDEGLSADRAGGVESVELAEVTYGGVACWRRRAAQSQGR